MTQSNPHDAADRQFDEDLRRALDAPPGVADRLARQALDRPDVQTHRSPWLRPALAAVALLALVSASVWILSRSPPESAPRVADRPAVADPRQEPPTARLSISSLDGPVTVTTADGTRWISLSPSSTSPGSPTAGDPAS